MTLNLQVMNSEEPSCEKRLQNHLLEGCTSFSMNLYISAISQLTKAKRIVDEDCKVLDLFITLIGWGGGGRRCSLLNLLAYSYIRNYVFNSFIF